MLPNGRGASCVRSVRRCGSCGLGGEPGWESNLRVSSDRGTRTSRLSPIFWLPARTTADGSSGVHHGEVDEPAAPACLPRISALLVENINQSYQCLARSRCYCNASFAAVLWALAVLIFFVSHTRTAISRCLSLPFMSHPTGYAAGQRQRAAEVPPPDVCRERSRNTSRAQVVAREAGKEGRPLTYRFPFPCLDALWGWE